MDQTNRVYITHTEQEWIAIQNEISNFGFESIHRFVHHKLRKGFPLLLDRYKEQNPVTKSFSLPDEEVYRRMMEYCRDNKINVSKLARRLSTEPLVLKMLLGELPGF